MALLPEYLTLLVFIYLGYRRQRDCRRAVSQVSRRQQLGEGNGRSERTSSIRIHQSENLDIDIELPGTVTRKQKRETSEALSGLAENTIAHI